MTKQYRTKAWAKWAKQNLEVALSLLQSPDKQWDKDTTYREAAIKSLAIIEKELEEVS